MLCSLFTLTDHQCWQSFVVQFVKTIVRVTISALSNRVVDNNRRTLGPERIISTSFVVFQPNETISLLPQFQNSLEAAFRFCSGRKEFTSFLSQAIHRVQWPWAFMFLGYDSKSSQVRRSRGKGVEAHLRELTRTPKGNQNFGPQHV